MAMGIITKLLKKGKEAKKEAFNSVKCPGPQGMVFPAIKM
jgi:hypothetical protein